MLQRRAAEGMMAKGFPVLPNPGLLHDAVARNEERIKDMRRQLAEMDHLLEELESHPDADRVPFEPGLGGPKTG